MVLKCLITANRHGGDTSPITLFYLCVKPAENHLWGKVYFHVLRFVNKKILRI